MSSYRNQTALRRAEAGAAVCALARVDVDDTSAIAEAAHAIEHAASVYDAAAAVTTLTSGARTALETLAPVAWPTLSVALAAPTATVDLLSAAGDAFAEAERSLGAAARTALVDTVMAFVAEPAQGFAHVDVARGEHVTAIHAVRAESHETVVFQVDDGGGIEHEYAGHVGTSCEVRAAEFEQYAAARGVNLDTRVHEPRTDGRPDGARLILDATQRDAQNPARGAVLNAEQPARARARAERSGIFASSTSPSRASVSRRTVGGAA